MTTNWLDISILIICIVAFFRGFQTGFVKQLASLVGIVLGAIFAGKVAEKIYPHILGWFENSPNLAMPISYLIGFLLILIAVNIIGGIIHSIMKVALLSPLNKIVGAVFCLGKWILIISILLNLTAMFDTNKSIIKEEVRAESRSYSTMMEIAQTIIPYLRLDNYTAPSMTPPREESTLPESRLV